MSRLRAFFEKHLRFFAYAVFVVLMGMTFLAWRGARHIVDIEQAELLLTAATLGGGFLISLLIFLYLLNMAQVSKEVEKEAQQRSQDLQKFQKAVELATDGIIITTPEPKIVYVNKAWEKLNGYSRFEVFGKNPNILQSGKTPSQIYETMWKTLAEGDAFVTEEVINKQKDGTEYQARLSVFPITNEEGVTEFYVGMVEDITERKDMDEAKTEFVSLASHQLRTPLSVIDWYSESLMSGSVGPLNEKQRSYIQEIYNTNQHMLKLVDMLLNASRLELGTLSAAPEPTNIRKLAQEVLRELGPSINKKSITVTTEFDENLPTIRVDKNLVRIVLQNILSNAVRYTPGDGRVWLSIQRQKQGQKIKSRVIPDDSIFISIADTGIGIPKEEQAKIFSKLFRARNAQEHHAGGTGLGLYIAKSIIDQTGGSLWFESEEGVGTTFYITIPISGMRPGDRIHVSSPSDRAVNTK